MKPGLYIATTNVLKTNLKLEKKQMSTHSHNSQMTIPSQKKG